MNYELTDYDKGFRAAYAEARRKMIDYQNRNIDDLIGNNKDLEPKVKSLFNSLKETYD